MDRNPKGNSIRNPRTSPLEREALMNEFNVDVFFKQDADLDFDGTNLRNESETSYNFYIPEEKL
jgi:hypothetical protein